MATDAEFEAFAPTAWPALFRTAWLLTHDRQASEDLAQEALAKVFVRWRTIDAIASPLAYARTTLVRTFISSRRRASAGEVVSDLVDSIAAPDDPTVRLTIHRALAELSPLDRAVIVLRHLEQRTVTEVAGDLRLTESAVRSRASRAAARLRALLRADFPELAATKP